MCTVVPSLKLHRAESEILLKRFIKQNVHTIIKHTAVKLFNEKSESHRQSSGDYNKQCSFFMCSNQSNKSVYMIAKIQGH